MVNYVVAIPSYNRYEEIQNKTLKTLKDGNVPKKNIYIFVANKKEEKLYRENIDKSLYHKIVIGKLGITNQRNFIVNYFPENQYIISIDDDVEKILYLNKKGDKLIPLIDIHSFFIDAYKILIQEKLYIWGVYPVHNPFFMSNTTTTGLKFIIGVLRGFINRHTTKIKPSIFSETKEDIEQTIKYYLFDGGVVRFNFITTKTKFNAPGGLGTDRYERNKKASIYIAKTYPDYAKIYTRKNGTYEIRLSNAPRIL